MVWSAWQIVAFVTPFPSSKIQSLPIKTLSKLFSSFSAVSPRANQSSAMSDESRLPTENPPFFSAPFPSVPLVVLGRVSRTTDKRRYWLDENQNLYLIYSNLVRDEAAMIVPSCMKMTENLMEILRMVQGRPPKLFIGKQSHNLALLCLGIIRFAVTQSFILPWPICAHHSRPAPDHPLFLYPAVRYNLSRIWQMAGLLDNSMFSTYIIHDCLDSNTGLLKETMMTQNTCYAWLNWTMRAVEWRLIARLPIPVKLSAATFHWRMVGSAGLELKWSSQPPNDVEITPSRAHPNT